MSTDLHTDAFVLSSIPFKDYDRIVTLFSKEMGQIKVFVNGANRPKSNKLALSEPLTYASYLLRKKRGDFYTFIEGKLLDPFLGLRDSYEHLTAGFDLLHAILKSQVEQYPSADLFSLLKSYLKQMVSSKDPKVLVSSFYLKVLLFEGCLTLKSQCSRCHKKPSHLYFCFKDYFCKECAPVRNLVFSSEELKTVFELVKERSFQELSQKQVDEGLEDKIRKLYGELHEISL